MNKDECSLHKRTKTCRDLVCVGVRTIKRPWLLLLNQYCFFFFINFNPVFVSTMSVVNLQYVIRLSLDNTLAAVNRKNTDSNNIFYLKNALVTLRWRGYCFHSYLKHHPGLSSLMGPRWTDDCVPPLTGGIKCDNEHCEWQWRGPFQSLQTLGGSHCLSDEWTSASAPHERGNKSRWGKKRGWWWGGDSGSSPRAG